MTLAVIDNWSLSMYLLFGSFAATFAIIAFWDHQTKVYDREHPPVDGQPQRNPYRESAQTVTAIAVAIGIGLFVLAAYLKPAT